MRAALFDLDETLLDRSGSLRDFVTWQVSGMLKSSIDNKQLFVERFVELDQNGMVWKDKVYESLITEFGITEWSVDELLSVYELTFCAFCKPRDGAVAAVSKCREMGFKIGLVSNGKTPFQERNFNALGISELFDCVVVSEAVGLRKPDKKIFELACRLLDADINTSVFVGDNPIADIQGAKQAGMATLYVPVKREHELCDYADATFYEFSELVSFVDNQPEYSGQ